MDEEAKAREWIVLKLQGLMAQLASFRRRGMYGQVPDGRLLDGHGCRRSHPSVNVFATTKTVIVVASTIF